MAQEVGRFFVDLRRAFRASQAQIAAHLATRPDIIAALEAGHVRALPPWPETTRIVRGYAALASLDPRPALHSLEMLLQAEALSPTPPPASKPKLARLPAPRTAPRHDEPFDDEDAGALGNLRELWDSGVGQAARVLLAITIPVALVVLVTQTSVLEAAVSKLPPPVARFVRGAQNYVIVQFAPVRDGLRWIDVPDPRSRRTDKLRTTAQSD